MMEHQCSLSIEVPYLSKTTALKTNKQGVITGETAQGEHSWVTETNQPRTTEMYTKKLPTFSRSRLEKKGHLFFQCVQTSREMDPGWAGHT